MNTIKAGLTPTFFFKPSRGMSYFFFFPLLNFVKKKNLFYGFTCIFLKVIFVYKPPNSF